MDVNQDCVMEDEIDEDLINTQEATFDVTYTNLEKLFWDTTKDPPRYNQQVSDDIVDEITIEDNTDDYDATRFWTIVNEWENIDGMAYIDHSQWKDTTITYEEQPIYCADISDEDAPEDCIEEIEGLVSLFEKYNIKVYRPSNIINLNQIFA